MISVVLATHNEEKAIEACLQAVAQWVDEIVIVDGESSDNTVSLAKKFGALVIATTNKENFHINKQMAIDAAQHELILQLDADEIVDAELQEFIKTTHSQLAATGFNRQKAEPVVWWIKRKNYFLGSFLKKGGQYPDPVIRLFIKDKARLPQKDVHEQMVVDGEIGWADGHLIHYGNPSFSDYLRKFNTYTSFKANQLKDQNLSNTLITACLFLIWKPIATFFQLYFRHKGVLDGVPGLVFAAFSGLHHAVAFLKFRELKEKENLYE